MKNLWLCVAMLLVSAAACRKSNDDHADQFAFDLDGKHYRFDSVSSIVDTSAGPFVISLYALNTETKSNVIVGLQANTTLTPLGAYLRADTNRILITFVINIIDNNLLTQYVVQGPAAFALTLTNVNGRRMKGNFSGQLPVVTGSGLAEVKNGLFDAPYHPE